MTNQEIFDQVTRHLLTQQKKSIDHTGCCSFRGERGLKCALGIFIPNNKYKADLEGYEFGTINEMLKLGFGPEQTSFMYSLMSIHDRIPVDGWESSLRQVAIDNELEFTGI